MTSRFVGTVQASGGPCGGRGRDVFHGSPKKTVKFRGISGIPETIYIRLFRKGSFPVSGGNCPLEVLMRNVMKVATDDDSPLFRSGTCLGGPQEGQTGRRETAETVERPRSLYFRNVICNSIRNWVRTMHFAPFRKPAVEMDDFAARSMVEQRW